MGKTLTQKIIARALGKKHVAVGEMCLIEPDLMILYDWPALSDWYAEMMEKELGLQRVPFPDRVVMFLDHMLPVQNQWQADFHQQTREWCDKQGIVYYEGRGIGHSVVVEEGLVRPGMLAAHFDTHVSTIGAVGALGFGLMKEMLMPLATGKMWLQVPPVIRVNLEGAFQPGVSGRDLLHRLVADFGPDWGNGKVIEFGGAGAKNVSIDSRMAICDLINYVGSITAMFVPDETTGAYLAGMAPKQAFVTPDDDAGYTQTVTYDLSGIEPTVVAPPSIANAKAVGEVLGKKIDLGIIGTCAAGRVEDLAAAAKILAGKRIKAGFKLFVVPSSEKSFLQALEKGYINTLVEAGAFLSSPTCDFCYAKAVYLSEGQRAISTQTLNVPGRLGNMQGEIYLASAEMVAAAAVNGRIEDPRLYWTGE